MCIPVAPEVLQKLSAPHFSSTLWISFVTSTTSSKAVLVGVDVDDEVVGLPDVLRAGEPGVHLDAREVREVEERVLVSLQTR